MSEKRPGEIRRATRGVFRAALLCAGASLCLPAAAIAQQTALRGEVAEADINADLLGSVALQDKKSPLDEASPQDAPPQDGIPTPVYAPSSEGATPDPEPSSTGATSIFDDPGDEGAFDEEPTITPTARPTTAAAREETRKRDNDPAESVARRLSADRAERAGVEEADDNTGTVRVDTVDSETELKTDPQSERVEAIEDLDADPDLNPYAPVGIRVGTFIVSPTLESGLTWTSNADSSPDGEPALLSETTLRLNAVSDFDGDRTVIDAFGNYRATIDGEEIEETRAGIDAALERDIGGDWRVLATLGYEVGPESASSPDAIEGIPEQPIKHLLNGSLGIEKDIGKLRLRLTGNVEREMYGDAELSTGGSISQADRNSTLGSVVLRTGYEISPALIPFVEMEYGRRQYDEDLDSNGYARSSDRVGARGGLQFELSEKFLGEVSAGWIEEKIDDDRLASISGPSVAASVDWSPERGTTIGLDAETIVEDSTDPGESGSILYQGRINASRELRANLTADLGGGLGLREYTDVDGQDVIWDVEAGMTYWFNRYVGLTGKARHEQLESTFPDRDYETNSVFLGLKLQR